MLPIFLSWVIWHKNQLTVLPTGGFGSLSAVYLQAHLATFLAKLSTAVTDYAIALATLGNALHAGLFLFVSCHPRWPKQVCSLSLSLVVCAILSQGENDLRIFCTESTWLNFPQTSMQNCFFAQSKLHYTSLYLFWRKKTSALYG